MKNIFLILILLSFTCSVSFDAGDLQVGDTAPEWSFSDSEDQSFSMASWPNKVLLVSYVDPDESDVNESFNEALQAARKDGRLQDADYQGVGIGSAFLDYMGAKYKEKDLMLSITSSHPAIIYGMK